MNEEHLQRRIAEISAERNLTAVSVALHDYQTDRSFELEGGRWFHAASVIKLAVLLGVFKAVRTACFGWTIRSMCGIGFAASSMARFIASSGTAMAMPNVTARGGPHHADRGTLRAMIVRSSNIATNLLLDLLGLEFVRRALSHRRCRGSG
jgi:beta-lactamase class A